MASGVDRPGNESPAPALPAPADGAVQPAKERRKQERYKIARLAPELRREFEARLESGRYTVRENSAWLESCGVRISPNAIYNFRRRFEDRLRAVRSATDQAEKITKGCRGSDHQLTRALTMLCQTRLFDMTVAMNEAIESLARVTHARRRSRLRLSVRAAKQGGASEDGDGADELKARYALKAEMDAMHTLARTVATLGKLEKDVADWRAQEAERIEKSVANAHEQVQQAAREGGLSSEAEARIRAALLDIKV